VAKTEPKARLISLAAPGIELHQARGPAKQQHKNTRRQRIERAQNVRSAGKPAKWRTASTTSCDVFPFRLVDDERAVDRAGCGCRGILEVISN